MNEEAVEPQAEPIEHIVDQAQADYSDQDDNGETERSGSQDTMVPLFVAQKLRDKNRELELRLQWEQQEREKLSSNAVQKVPEDDTSRYESATREDLNRSQAEIVRIVEEKRWIKDNPEKYELVNAQLTQFLKQRPNLTTAISQASNRYEEAYELMDKLTPKQQQQLARQATPKKEAPNAPSGVPKAAAMNDALDVMNMSDSEFTAWRASKKRSR